jgi:hypothetical protein
MDDNNRISITVCGDGGCGMCLLVYQPNQGLYSGTLEYLTATNRQIFNHTAACAKPVDPRVSIFHSSVIAIKTH